MNKEYRQIMHFFRHFEYANVIYIKPPSKCYNVHYEGYSIVVPLNDPPLLVAFNVIVENGKIERFRWKKSGSTIVFEGSGRKLSKYLAYIENYTEKWDHTMDYDPALM